MGKKEVFSFSFLSFFLVFFDFLSTGKKNSTFFQKNKKKKKKTFSLSHTGPDPGLPRPARRLHLLVGLLRVPLVRQHVRLLGLEVPAAVADYVR